MHSLASPQGKFDQHQILKLIPNFTRGTTLAHATPGPHGTSRMTCRNVHLVANIVSQVAIMVQICFACICICNGSTGGVEEKVDLK